MNFSNLINEKTMLGLVKLLNKTPIIKFFIDHFVYLYYISFAKKRQFKINIDKYKKIRSPFFIGDSIDFRRVFFNCGLHDPKRKCNISFLDITPLFSNSNLAIISGPAGSGKSTLLKNYLLELHRSKNKIPILIELRNILNNEENTLISSMLKFFPFQNEFTLFKTLKKDGIIFLLDGFDEISSEIENSIINEIISISQEYRNTKFIITSRPNFKLNQITEYSHFIINPILKEARESFIRNYFYENSNTGIELIHELKSNKSNYLNDFLKNPLLFTIFLFTYNLTRSIPKSKIDLFEQVINTLLSRHDNTKPGYNRDLFTKLKTTELLNLIREFSFISLIENKLDFKKIDIEILFSKLNTRAGLSHKIDHNDFINDCLTSTSILIEDGLKYYYAHKLIQEYLSCQFIKLEDKSNQFYELLNPFKPKTKLHKNHEFLYFLEEIDRENFNNFFYIPTAKKVLDFFNSDDEMVLSRKFLEFTCKGIQTCGHSPEFLRDSGSYQAYIIPADGIENLYFFIKDIIGFIDYFQYLVSDYVISKNYFEKTTFIFSENQEFLNEITTCVHRVKEYERLRRCLTFLRNQINLRLNGTDLAHQK